MNSGRIMKDGNSGIIPSQNTVSFGFFVKEASFESNDIGGVSHPTGCLITIVTAVALLAVAFTTASVTSHS